MSVKLEKKTIKLLPSIKVEIKVPANQDDETNEKIISFLTQNLFRIEETIQNMANNKNFELEVTVSID